MARPSKIAYLYESVFMETYTRFLTCFFIVRFPYLAVCRQRRDDRATIVLNRDDPEQLAINVFHILVRGET